MKSNYVIYILLGVIFILFVFIIFRKKDVKIITTDTSILEQQIKDKKVAQWGTADGKEEGILNFFGKSIKNKFSMASTTTPSNTVVAKD